MRKKLLSLVLAVCMILSMLPGTAYAAVSELLDNTPEQNKSLLEQLAGFTGESYGEVQKLLDTLGLLDEDGNLVTDQTIDLDGKTYTLEEMEALLSDPDTDLTRVAEVDGVPIALKDLATIIAIERELQYLQEKYFTGASFEGEALANVNSLLSQLQSQGLTLAANSNQIVFDTSDVKKSGNTYYITTQEVTVPAGTTLSVKFKMDFSDAFKALFSGYTSMLNGELFIYLSDDVSNRQSLGYGSYQDIYLSSENTMSAADGKEYTLSATFSKAHTGPLYLCMTAPGMRTFKEYEQYFPFDVLTFGNIWQDVSFYDAQGVLFQNGTGSVLSDQGNGYWGVEISLPAMGNSCSVTGSQLSFSGGRNFLEFLLVDNTSAIVDNTLTYLQRCITNLNVDNAVRFQVSATLAQTNDKKYPLIIPKDVFLYENSGRDDLLYHSYYIIEENSLTGNFPITLNSGSSKATISFTGLTDKLNSSDGTSCILPRRFSTVMCNSTSVTPEQIDDLQNISKYTYSISSFTSTTDCTINLVDDKTGPTLTVSAPAGTYQSGDVIPITITGNEFIKATDDTRIAINGTEYTLAQLHGSTSGKYISFFYEVKEIDSAGLTVGIASNSGITDYWGNKTNEVNNISISDVTLDSPLLKNAVTGLTASYDTETEKLSFTISAKQDDGYQTLYTNSQTPFQLLISVNGGEPETHSVTMGEDPGNPNNIIFTAAPYAISPTAEDQNITVRLQIKDGDDWVTVNRVTQYVTIARRVDVQSVSIGIVGGGTDYEIALSDEKIPQLQAAVAPAGAATSGAWHSTDESIATISQDGQIGLKSKTGKVSFYYVADNGTPDVTGDDKESDRLEFTITAGDNLSLVIPEYAQESLLQSGSDATVTWNTNAFDFYPGQDIRFTVKLYAGAAAAGEPAETYTVENPASSTEKVTQCTIPAEDLPVTYPQSQYTVEVSMSSPEAKSDTASITVLSPPTEMRITSDKTDLTDGESASLTCTIGNNPDAAGTLSAKRMTDGGTEDADSCLSIKSVKGSGTVTFTPEKVSGSSLYDTYTITFTEDTVTGANFAPSSASIVLRVYRSGALEIQPEGPITMDNTSKVNGTLPTDSADILALRQELGLIEYVSINADAYNWSSLRDGIEWVSDHPEAVGVYYRQGGLWDNIEDLANETYLPRAQMAVSATDDAQNVTITATHAATGMSDSVTVDVKTLRDKFYLFQATPAVTTDVTYTNGADETKTIQTNSDGLLALYEPSGIKSDVYFRSGSEKEPNLGTILNSALSSGERDAAKLQLYPLNAITLVPAAKAELYLVKPDGTPLADEDVTLRGGVYLGGYYCEGAQMGPTSDLISGATDGKYTTDADGKLTVYMDATQFEAEGYTGQLTNAALDYWFELRDLSSGSETYFPTLVNVQGSMSADRILRTGSSVVNLEAVPQGREEQPFLTAQTMSYGKESGGDLQVRDVLGSTGRVGPNSTYKYAELTSYFMLWGVDTANGKATVSMTGENGFAPKGQTVEDSSFPFSAIPIVTNTTVLTKETMTDSGWLKPETAARLRACVYQNDRLVKDVSMPFQVIDLTDVKLVNEDAKAVVLDMQGSFKSGLGSGSSRFSFGNSSISGAFNDDIGKMLASAANSSNPLFKVLITPTEDSTVFNVLVWGGYDSLDLKDFNYDQDGLAMDYELLDTELEVGVPGVGDLSDMAKGTYNPSQTLSENSRKTLNSGLDFGAQLTGCYEGQFYYDTDQHEWAFRVVSGGFTAGAGVGFEANVNFWAGPIPITASFGAGLALQLDYKAATVYTDQQSEATLAGWTDEAKASDSVNDFLTTLRINGYIKAFGGVGFDYSIVALKIGLFGKLTGDSTNQFLSRTYLTSGQQRNGQALGVEGEVGIKVVVKLLLISYDGALVSGKIRYSEKFGDYQYINDYWTGNGTSTTSLAATPTLLSRAYLAAYANGERTWNTPGFNTNATVVQSDANPGSEPVVNDDGSLSAYISDRNSGDFYASRIMAGAVGTEGTVIDDDGDDTNNGFGDLSPSLSGTGSFTVAAWARLNTKLEKNADASISPDEQKQLLNSTEIMVAATSDGGASWTTEKLTDNASPDLAPVTAASGSNAVVFWRNVYTSTDTIYSTDSKKKFAFDTKDAIYFSCYDGSAWSDAQMAYNGSLGGVVGLKTAMLSDGTSILAFTLDRGSGDSENPMAGYELAYRTVSPDGTLGDLVVLTNDQETDTNPQVVAADGSFILGWYSTQDGGDIRLQAVGADGQLYNGGSEHAIPASVKAISREDDLNINANFQFARQSGQGVSGLTLVWAETASNADGEADHSVLYGTQLCKIEGNTYLSSPQALITLPSRTLSNSFSAWKDGSGKISAYIFGTQYSEAETETVAGVNVPKDTDQLLTGGGSLTVADVSVDAISVDYAGLRTESFTPVGFTLRNTGTTRLTDLKAEVGGDSSDAVTLNPGETASVTVMYKTGSTITNPAYTVSADGSGPLAGDTLHLDYNDVGISSMEVVRESEGERTVQVTLYNDAAAKLADTMGRTVTLSFFTDSEYTQPADVTLVGSQSGVSVSGNTATLSGDALRRIDQGSMTFQVAYDLKGYVTGTLKQDEVPASGVYLYAKAEVKENRQTMAEYATGNNTTAVQLTGAYARTGEKTTLDVTQTNTDITTAVVELKNNSLQDQTTATLMASLLDENDQVLETKTTGITGTLPGETAQTITIPFSQLGSRVVVHAAAAGEDSLTFDGLPVSMKDFAADETGVLTYTISGISANGTLVTAISGSGEKVTINGTEFAGGSGSLYVPIGVGETVITVSIGSTAYSLHITSTHTSGGGVSSSYPITVESGGHGEVTASRSTAGAGTTVTLTTKPEDGYRLASLTATDRAGKTITLHDKGDGTYTFTMPASAVRVKAAFVSEDLPFIDVPAGAWYEEGVRYVYQNGLMAGTGAATFSPDVTTSRSMIAAILWRLEGSPVVDYAMTFGDVDQGSWYGEAVRWAASEGIVAGYGNNRFGPDDPITREQMAAMLHRYAQYKGYDVSIGENTNILSYKDFAELGEYAIPAMQWAVGSGIIQGVGDGRLSPCGSATRAQAAAMLQRFCEEYVTW